MKSAEGWLSHVAESYFGFCTVVGDEIVSVARVKLSRRILTFEKLPHTSWSTLDLSPLSDRRWPVLGRYLSHTSPSTINSSIAATPERLILT